MNPKKYFPALSEVATRRYFLGQGVSIVCSWTQTITLNLMLWEEIHSAAYQGVLNFLLYGPMLILPAVFGSRLRAANVRAVTLCIVAASLMLSTGLCWAVVQGVLVPDLVLLAGVVMGVIAAIEMPSRQLLLTTVLRDKSLFFNAVATNTLVFNLGRMLGPAVAAMLYGFGPSFAFALGAAGALLMFCMVAGVHAPQEALAQAQQRGSLKEACRHVLGNPFARRFVPTLVCLGIFVASYQTLIPVLAGAVYGDAARFTGILFACAGAGSLCAALLLSGVTGDATRARLLRWTPWSCGAALACIAVTSSALVTAGCLWVLGAGLTLSTTTINATLQRGCPDWLRGGMVGIYAMAFLGTVPLGHLLVGALAQAVGIRLAFGLMSLGILAFQALMTVKVDH